MSTTTIILVAVSTVTTALTLTTAGMLNIYAKNNYKALEACAESSRGLLEYCNILQKNMVILKTMIDKLEKVDELLQAGIIGNAEELGFLREAVKIIDSKE